MTYLGPKFKNNDNAPNGVKSLFLTCCDNVRKLHKDKKQKESKELILHTLSLVDGSLDFPIEKVCDLLHLLSTILVEENQLEAGILQTSINAAHFKEIKQYRFYTQSLGKLSSNYFRMGDFQNSILFAQKAVSASEEYKLYKLSIKPLNNIRGSYNNLGQYHQAFTNYYKAINLCKTYQEHHELPVLYYNTIVCLLLQSRLDLAKTQIEEFNKAHSEIGFNNRGQFFIHYSTSLYHTQQKDYQALIETINKIKEEKLINSNWDALLVNDNLVDGYIGLHQYNKAFELLILTSKQFFSYISSNKIEKSAWSQKLLRLIMDNPLKKEYYLEHDTVKELFTSNLTELVKDLKSWADVQTNPYSKKKLYELLKRYYEDYKDYQSANEVLNKLLEINKQLNDTAKTNQIIQIQEQYQAKQLRQQLNFEQQLLKEQKEINQKLENFAHVTAHDLKEPLRGISGFSKILKEKTYSLLEPKDQECWDYIINSTQRMDRLIRDILDFSKIGNSLPPPSLIDLNQLIEKVLKNLKGKINQVKGQIIYENLPQIWAHEVTLVRLFQNLIGNALKFIKPNNPPIIMVNHVSQNGNLLFSISDNGIGIPPDKCETIFDAFRRLYNRSEYEGSGLGLATCRKIVELYQGEIWAESIENEGTTFYFTLATESTTEEQTSI